MGDRQITAGIIERLRGHYIPDTKDPAVGAGGEFAHEVSINGNFGHGNRCDALYAGFTSASGRILIGHEIKVSRSDWRAELAKTGKADYWADACHAWYIVAPSTTIVPPEELPEAWGLMTPPRAGAKRFKIVRKAHVKTDHTPPWDAVRSFMARLDTIGRHDVGTAVRAALKDQREELTKRHEQRLADQVLDPEDRARLIALAELEEHLGVTLTQWNQNNDSTADPRVFAHALDLARAVRHTGPIKFGAEALLRDLRHLGNMTERVEAVQAALADLQEVKS